MRIRDFILESWWKDLDPGFLSMMGYSGEEPAAEAENHDTLAQDVKSIRSVHQPKKL
jgi:hypothetical protein